MHLRICILALLSIFAGNALARRIAAFHGSDFGNALMNNPTRLAHFLNIVKRSDLVLVQNIRELDQKSIYKFMNLLNDQVSKAYNVILSKRLGTGSYKEQYAFIYKVDYYELECTYQFNNTNVPFHRPPFCAKFERIPEADDLILCGFHVDPELAPGEIDRLADVYDDVVAHWGNPNILILGNFDADCDYVKPTDWPNIRLRTQTRFSWLFNDDVDTATHSNDCAYDRMVVAGPTLPGKLSSPSVLNYETAFGISQAESTDISDHYTVEVIINP